MVMIFHHRYARLFPYLLHVCVTELWLCGRSFSATTDSIPSFITCLTCELWPLAFDKKTSSRVVWHNENERRLLRWLPVYSIPGAGYSCPHRLTLPPYPLHWPLLQHCAEATATARARATRCTLTSWCRTSRTLAPRSRSSGSSRTWRPARRSALWPWRSREPAGESWGWLRSATWCWSNGAGMGDQTPELNYAWCLDRYGCLLEIIILW